MSGLANGLGVFGARAESQATTKSNPIAQNDLGVLGAQVAPPGATTAAASSHSVGQTVPLASSSQLLSGLPALVGVRSKVLTSVHHSWPAVSIAASWVSDPVSSAPFVSMASLGEIAGVTTSISLPLTSIYAPAAPATSTAFIHPDGPPASSSVGHRYPSPSSAAYTSPVLPTSAGYTSAPYFVPPLDPTAAAFAAGVCGARPEGTAVGVSPSDSWPRGTYGVRPPELNSPDGWIDDLDLHRRSASYGSRSLARLPKRELMKFDGDPIKYPMFMRGFGVQVDRFCYDDSERQEFLRCSLSEEIQRHLGYLLMHPGGYHQCLLELRDRYGSPRVVAAACSKALFRLATFRDHDFKALSFFASSLRSVVATLQLSGFEDEMRSQATLQQVVSKLPPLLKDKWADYSVDIVDRLPSLVDLDNWLHRRVSADYYVRAGSDSSVPSTARDHQEPKGGGKGSFKPKVFAATDTQPKCSCCDRPHPTRKCRKFQELDPAKRTEVVREKRLCLRCLDSDHLWAACKSDEKCGQDGCEKTHHRLMHGAPSLFPPRDGASGPRHRGKGRTGKAPSSTEGVKASVDIPTSRLASFATVSTVQPKLVLLPIVPVIISANGHSVSTFALLDPGSEVTMLCESVKKKLNLTGPTEKAVIGTWHANDPAFKTTRVAFSVSSADEGTSFAVAGGYTVPSLNLTKRPIARDKLVKKWPHLASVPLKQVDAAEVTLLVGTDHGDMHDVYEYRRDPLRVNAPKGILTAFGWTVTGDVWPAMGGDDRESPLSYRLSLSSGREVVKKVQCFRAAVGEEPSQMDNLILAVDQFLMQEAFAAVPEAKVPVGRDVARSRRILEATTRYRPDLGRYEAGILWAEDKPNLPDNRQGALERYRKTMRRLERNKEIADIVEREMNGYFDLGFAEKLTEEEVKGLVPGSFWLLPWHVVPHPYKPGKWRLVYDAKAAFGGVSLNSKLLKGEVLHVNMLGILIRMREFKVVVCGDITKMFHQVRVREADRNTFLFYRGGIGSPLPPELSRMVVFIFGSVSSPAVCAHVLRKSALDADPEDSQVAVREVDNVLKKGGFELAQWGSSSRRVLSQLPGNPVAALNLDIEGLPTERTLGISLDFHADCFVLKAMGNVDCKTRREILRATARNFDPLGFLAPVLLHAKLILQSIFQVTADWDATLGSSFLEKWRNWAGSLIAVNDLRIPRCFCPEEYNPDAVDLLMFSDSSERAFGAEGILRFELTNGTVKTAFVMAKSKVAPAAYVSMPRLELCGCLMSARMAAAIVKELRIKIRHVVLFTDSTTNLRWINSRECKFTPYVSSRVGEILELYDPPHWRYVPTLLNPADDLSRGLEAEELKVSHRFYTGPAFVQQPMEEWPTLPDLKLPSDAPPDPEVRAVKFVGVAKDSVPYIDTLLASVKPFSRIKRTVAYVVRWINVVRARVRERKSRDTVETSFPVATSVASQAGGSSTLVAAAATSSSAPAQVRVTTVKKNVAAGKEFIVAAPTPDEIAAAVLLLIKRAQAREYARELRVINRGGCLDMSFPIARCLPYIDEQGLLRVGGRLQNAPVPFDVRHPIILPPKAKVTERIVREIHLKTGHSRPWRTLPEVQRLYWITAPR